MRISWKKFSFIAALFLTMAAIVFTPESTVYAGCSCEYRNPGGGSCGVGGGTFNWPGTCSAGACSCSYSVTCGITTGGSSGSCPY